MMPGADIWVHVLTVFCVFLISAGQLLFKLTASTWEQKATVFSLPVLFTAGVAIFIYASATILWIFLLRYAPLNRLYPYMALSFVFVAVGGRFLYGESMSIGMLVGLGLIVAGVTAIAKFG